MTHLRVFILALLLVLSGCSDRFTTAEGAGGQGGAPADETGGAPATGGAEATGGAPATGGAVSSGGTPGTGGAESTCAAAFVCSYDTKLGDVVSAYGKNWECQTPEYCISCGVHPACAPGAWYAGSGDPWQCETAWKKLGACE